MRHSRPSPARPLVTMNNLISRLPFAMILTLGMFAVSSLFARTATAQGVTQEGKIFLIESHRTIPPLHIPPPTAAEESAPRPADAEFIPLESAMALIGLDGIKPDAAARIPGGKIGIIDHGYRGLKAWLASHPGEARWTTYVGTSLEDGVPSRTDEADSHGYLVYRLIRAALPDVPIYLFDDPSGSNQGAFAPIVDAYMNYGIRVFNMSFTRDDYCGLSQNSEDDWSTQARYGLVPRQIFLFVAAGNARGSTNTWVTPGTTADGHVEFRTQEQAQALPGSRVDGQRVALYKGTSYFMLGWDAHQHAHADYTLELDDLKGNRLVSTQEPSTPAQHCVILQYRSSDPKTGIALLRIKRIGGPASGIPMRLQAFSQSGYVFNAIGDPADFNGLQTAASYEYRSNPFMVFSGSFGMTSNGWITPSPFSDIGQRADGTRVPDVLGPGQLTINGREHAGTSFSSPLIAALYAAHIGYNLKNLVQLTSDDDRFAPGVQPFERSRWGVPDPVKLADIDHLTGPTTVSDVKARVEGHDLVLHYTIARCCMQDLVWDSIAELYDANGQLIHGPDGKPVFLSAKLRTEQPGRVSYPVTLRFPMSELSSYKGKSVRIGFAMFVEIWRTVPPSYYGIEQPAYQFTL